MRVVEVTDLFRTMNGLKCTLQEAYAHCFDRMEEVRARPGGLESCLSWWTPVSKCQRYLLWIATSLVERFLGTRTLFLTFLPCACVLGLGQR